MKGWVIDSDAPSDGASSSLGIVFRKVVHKAITVGVLKNKY